MPKPEADGRTTRREFTRRIAAGATILAGLDVVGCGNQATPAGQTKAAGSVLSAGAQITTPPATRMADQVTWAISSEPGSLDWILAYDADSNTALSNITESLLQLTPEFDIRPGLAESYEHPDPLTWIFKLRQGVRFHDGSALTVDDVVYSLRRNLSPRSYWNVFTDTISDIRASSTNTVTVRLKRPDALFRWLMTLPVGGIGKASYIERVGAKAYGTPSAPPIGTGPLSMSSWESGRQINLKRNPAYWDTGHRSKVQSLTIVFIENSADLTQALLSGDVHGTYAAPASSVPVLSSQNTGKLYRGRSLQNAIIIPTQRKGPLLDPRVRAAWSQAIDRSAIASKVWNGAAAPLRSLASYDTWGPLLTDPQVRAAYQGLPGAAPDVVGAKRLMKTAGATGQHVTLTTLSDSVSQNTALLLQAAANQIGLNVTIQVKSAQAVLNLFYDAGAREATDCFYYVDYADVPDPLDLYVQYLLPAAPSNYNYDNAAGGRLVEQARRADNAKAELSKLLEIQRLCVSQVPHIPVVAPANLLYMNHAISGAPAAFVFHYHPWARDLGGK